MHGNEAEPDFKRGRVGERQKEPRCQCQTYDLSPETSQLIQA